MAGRFLRWPCRERALKMNNRMLETHPKTPIALIIDGKVKGGRSVSIKSMYSDFFSEKVIPGLS